MAELADLKLEEEIRLLRHQQRDLRVRLGLDALKLILLMAGGLGTFLLLQRPDALLHRRASEEERNRERAQLLLQWARGTDVQRKADELWVIRQVYGGDDQLFDRLEKLVSAEAKAADVTATLGLYERLSSERARLLVELGLRKKALKPGEAQQLKQRRLAALETKLNTLGQMLEAYGVAPPESIGEAVQQRDAPDEGRAAGNRGPRR